MDSQRKVRIMKTLTIFTPTYNRAETLQRTYDSLRKQTSKDFVWMIVDDGSVDKTKYLVEQWKKELSVEIIYLWQQNQGMHGAHNTAYAHVNTELNMCVDSDDYLRPSAIEKIIAFWKEWGSAEVGGIIGLNCLENGSIIGDSFPQRMKETTLRDYYETYKQQGDKKLIYRTDVIKRYPPYPIFPGEHYFGLCYLYNMIDESYPLLCLNEPLVVVDYRVDGSSKNMWRQYWNNPRGFAFLRLWDMQHTHCLKRKVFDHIHYVAHSLRIGDIHFIKSSPQKIWTIVALAPGLILFLWTFLCVRMHLSFKVLDQ